MEEQQTQGQQVIYWPFCGRYTRGKRTITRSEVFKSSSGHSVVFCEGISGYVSVDNITPTAPKEATFDDKFEHRW